MSSVPGSFPVPERSWFFWKQGAAWRERTVSPSIEPGLSGPTPPHHASPAPHAGQYRRVRLLRRRPHRCPRRRSQVPAPDGGRDEPGSRVAACRGGPRATRHGERGRVRVRRGHPAQLDDPRGPGHLHELQRRVGLRLPVGARVRRAVHRGQHDLRRGDRPRQPGGGRHGRRTRRDLARRQDLPRPRLRGQRDQRDRRAGDRPLHARFGQRDLGQHDQRRGHRQDPQRRHQRGVGLPVPHWRQRPWPAHLQPGEPRQPHLRRELGHPLRARRPGRELVRRARDRILLLGLQRRMGRPGADDRRRDEQGQHQRHRAALLPEPGLLSPGLAIRGPAALLPRRRARRGRGDLHAHPRLRRGRPGRGQLRGLVPERQPVHRAQHVHPRRAPVPGELSLGPARVRPGAERDRAAGGGLLRHPAGHRHG